MNSSPARRRVCGFCGVFLNAKNRAKEHVLRRSWLDRLGHTKSKVSSGFMSGAVLLGERNQAAEQVQAGEVCSACNNGWMNHLDLSVEDHVLKLAVDPAAELVVGRLGARQIARWILKTAIAFELTAEPSRRHIRTEIVRRVRRANWLPDGFAAFYCRSPLGQRGISVASFDAWPVECVPLVGGLPQSRRLKFCAVRQCDFRLLHVSRCRASNVCRS